MYNKKGFALLGVIEIDLAYKGCALKINLLRLDNIFPSRELLEHLTEGKM